jgi:uncharacterized protein
MTWRRGFVQSYVERDLALLGLAVDPQLLRKFWTMLAHFHGNIWNAQSFAKSLGVTAPTVNRYLNFMEQAFLIHKLSPFSINIKKRLVKSPKLYLTDTGILHHLTGIKSMEHLQGNVLLGASWEGYVIAQIRSLLDDDKETYYYRTHEGTESNLLIVEGGQPLAAIEIKYTSSPKISKGFNIAIDDLNTKKNFIITPQSADYLISQRVRVCSLSTFLNTYLQSL